MLIAGGLYILLRLRPPLKKVLSVSLVIGLLSEVIKVFSVAQIVPMVDPVIAEHGGKAALEWIPTGEYTPYLGMEHLPLELCSLFLLFLILALALRDGPWKRGLYAVMFASGTLGGIMGIAASSIAGDFATTAAFFAAPRAWQFFIYHSMVVTVSIYLGFREESGLTAVDWRKAILGLLLLDIPTFYLNSVFSSEVYIHDQAVGVTHRINFFSSYVNPFGLILTEKWQWIVYLCLRALAAAILIRILFFLLAGKTKGGKADESGTN